VPQELQAKLAEEAAALPLPQVELIHTPSGERTLACKFPHASFNRVLQTPADVPESSVGGFFSTMWQSTTNLSSTSKSKLSSTGTVTTAPAAPADLATSQALKASQKLAKRTTAEEEAAVERPHPSFNVQIEAIELVHKQQKFMGLLSTEETYLAYHISAQLNVDGKATTFKAKARYSKLLKLHHHVRELMFLD
jgi:hypothetical protein